MCCRPIQVSLCNTDMLVFYGGIAFILCDAELQSIRRANYDPCARTRLFPARKHNYTKAVFYKCIVAAQVRACVHACMSTHPYKIKSVRSKRSSWLVMRQLINWEEKFRQKSQKRDTAYSISETEMHEFWDRHRPDLTNGHYATAIKGSRDNGKEVASDL